MAAKNFNIKSLTDNYRQAVDKAQAPYRQVLEMPKTDLGQLPTFKQVFEMPIVPPFGGNEWRR